MKDELVTMEFDIPVWLYERYDRVSNVTNIPIYNLFGAAVMMGIFKRYDVMSDKELKDHIDKKEY